jgi:hypothetical protein
VGGMRQSNECFRTKEEIVHDVTFILNAPIHHGTKRAVLKNAAWRWTEFNGKYKGCPNWTERALAQHRRYPKRKLVHEHAVPLKVIYHLLHELRPATEEAVKRIFENLLHAVIVTPEEDKMLGRQFKQSMPPGFDIPTGAAYWDPWLRYRECGIEVVPNCSSSI